MFFFSKCTYDAILFYFASGYSYGLDRPALRFQCRNVYKKRVVDCDTKIFCVQFKLSRHIPFPTRCMSLFFVTNFRATGLQFQKNQLNGCGPARTPESVVAVNIFIQRSARRSVWKHEAVLGLFIRSMIKICH